MLGVEVSVEARSFAVEARMPEVAFLAVLVDSSEDPARLVELVGGLGRGASAHFHIPSWIGRTLRPALWLYLSPIGD